MRIIQYTGSGEHAGTFDFALSKVQRFMARVIRETKPTRAERNTPKAVLYKAYMQLKAELKALAHSTSHDILELDQDPRMDSLTAAMIGEVEFIVFCPECNAEYHSDRIIKDVVVDPADPLAPHNGRSYCCPKDHEVLFVPDLIQE
jgi:hypothetical protein